MSEVIINIDDLEFVWRAASDGFSAGVDFKTWLANSVIELRATVAAQAEQLEVAREMLDSILKNSREPDEGDCSYCNCEHGGGNEYDCYYDCPMNEIRAWLAANAPQQPQEEQGE